MRYVPVLLIIILLVSCPAPARGDEFRVVPSLSVREEYNSNILLTTGDARRDFITTISPGVEIVDRTARLDADLQVRLDRLEYADNRDLNATNQTYSGRIRYLLTPLFGVSAEAAYMRLPNPSLVTVSTGVVTTASPWDRATSSLSADYRFTEKTAALFSYTFGRDHFENATSSDNTSHDLNAGIEYDLGEYVPAMKGRANIGYGHYSFTDSRTQKITGTVGLSRKIDEVWSVSVDGGVIRARSTVSVSQPVPIVVGQEIVGYYLVPGQESNAGWGWVGKASLDYSGESMNGSLGYTRDLRPASGYNGAAESNALTLSAQYRLTYELSVLLTSGYYTLKSDPSQFSSQIINQKTFIVSPAVRYEFSRDVALESSYEYIKIDYPASNTSASRQVIAVRLSVQHPFFE